MMGLKLHKPIKSISQSCNLHITDKLLDSIEDDVLRDSFAKCMNAFELSCITSEFDQCLNVFDFEVPSDYAEVLKNIHGHIKQLVMARLGKKLLNKASGNTKEGMQSIQMLVQMNASESVAEKVGFGSFLRDLANKHA